MLHYSTGAQALKGIHAQLKARGLGLVVARPKR
ncbi:M15 family metallopeptidase [Thiorhodococcus mannitoliphagus]|uniref:M15 family metallopeptidase n=1 Tax=Thiorhodococcus mannitoliphagus TaxID=329406 RepID=A0A6P1E3I4_9GAMM|nr:M15 family metallopeptidase [Thiorhodococcus mannitoliphagus]NEX22245.1 M15 family metallopeptidase [Thiorhodococcus mannitoliphagus]